MRWVSFATALSAFTSHGSSIVLDTDPKLRSLRKESSCLTSSSRFLVTLIVGELFMAATAAIARPS